MRTRTKPPLAPLLDQPTTRGFVARCAPATFALAFASITLFSHNARCAAMVGAALITGLMSVPLRRGLRGASLFEIPLACIGLGWVGTVGSALAVGGPYLRHLTDVALVAAFLSLPFGLAISVPTLVASAAAARHAPVAGPDDLDRRSPGTVGSMHVIVAMHGLVTLSIAWVLARWLLGWEDLVWAQNLLGVAAAWVLGHALAGVRLIRRRRRLVFALQRGEVAGVMLRGPLLLSPEIASLPNVNPYRRAPDAWWWCVVETVSDVRGGAYRTTRLERPIARL